MSTTVADWSVREGFNLVLCIAVLTSFLSLVGIGGGYSFRSIAHRHFWLLTTLVTILWLPLAIALLPRWFYPNFCLPVLTDSPNWSWIEAAGAAYAQTTDEDNPVQFSPLFWLGLLLVCLGWLIGVIPSLARVMWGWAKLKRVRLSGTLYRLPKRTSAFLKKKYQVRRLPEVILCGSIQNAVAVGIFRPQIIVQRRLVHELSSKQLCDVLDHEMAHVVRRDCLVMFLEQVARACHWCNPLLRWLCNELARSREQMCDNTVLVQRPATAYGETLLRVAELSLGSSLSRRVLAMLSGWSDLRWRIRSILDPGQLRTMAVGRWSAFAMIAGIGFCGWLVGGISFTPERVQEITLPRSEPHAELVETDR